MWRAYRGNESTDDYVLAGSNVGVFFGFLSFSATLFSTFTIMGMPDFFRVHGVAAWIFLGVTDCAMAFVLLWFGSHLRKTAARTGFSGMSGFIAMQTGKRWAGYLTLLTLFFFLVPYVAIQIRGVSIFMAAIFPEVFPIWGWAVSIVGVMLIYSEIGGLKAIIYSDAIQGLLLLVTTWFVAAHCIGASGGIGGLIDTVGERFPKLLSAPGPNGLLDVQFLVASFFAMVVIPITQPQLMTRIVIMRDMRSMHLMALAVGVFSVLVIAPALFIGLYGAIQYPDSDTAGFLSQVLVFDQRDGLAAAVIVGLLAAAMSTADSQLFALGAELRSLASGSEKALLKRIRTAVFVFAVAALLFSILSGDELVMLARTSFAGTSLLSPLVLTCVLCKEPPRWIIVASTFCGVALYGGSVLGLCPDRIGTIRIELFLVLSLGLIAWLWRPRVPRG